MANSPENGDPRDDGLYRSVVGVLVASVLVGAVLALGGEALFDSRALANVGLGMALVAGAAYWVIRLASRRTARRGRHDASRGNDGEAR